MRNFFETVLVTEFTLENYLTCLPSDFWGTDDEPRASQDKIHGGFLQYQKYDLLFMQGSDPKS